MKRIIPVLATLSISFLCYAGGNPEHVTFPEEYKSEYTQYDVRNRANGKQVAVLYANETVINSAKSGQLADGSKIIMEVYKTVPGEDGKPKVGADGIYEKGKFAAVAVMEKNSNWDSGFSADDRAGNWGFAIYKTNGTPKDNNLNCATCHKPMPENDYMFSFQSLIKFTQE